MGNNQERLILLDIFWKGWMLDSFQDSCNVLKNINMQFLTRVPIG